MPLEIGQILEDKYRIVRLIGQGGMGAVYEGENTRIRRRVAIKVLHSVAAENPELTARFEHEAQAAGQIGSDHILEVLDLGTLPDGDRFMVMEFLDGESLSERIERLKRIQPYEAVGILVQVLSGLSAAHRAGIVHRDLKPENVFILKEKAGQPDFVKIIDFGISKFQASSGAEMRMTRTGAVLGTPYYMSPEQASGKSIDARSDVYSAGVILYEALTGCTPFEGNTYNELILKIVLSSPPPLSTLVPDLSPELCAIVERAMAREIEYRFQSADEFGQALFGWAQASGRAGATMLVPDFHGSQRAFMGTPLPGGGGRPVSMASSAGLGASTGMGQGAPIPGLGTPASMGQGAPMPGPGTPAIMGSGTPMPGAGQRSPMPSQPGIWGNTPDPGLLSSRGGFNASAGQLPSLSGSGVGSWGTTGVGQVSSKPKWRQWIAIATCGLAFLAAAVFGVVRLVRGPVLPPASATADSTSTAVGSPPASATVDDRLAVRPLPSASVAPGAVVPSGPETHPAQENAGIFIPVPTPLPPEPRVVGVRPHALEKRPPRPLPPAKNPGAGAPSPAAPAPPAGNPPAANTPALGY